MARWMGMVVVLTCSAGVAAAGEERPARGDLGDNAALHYWQAFAGLPQLNEAESKKLGECRTIPLDEQARKWVEGTDTSFRELRYGAAIPQCAWGVSYQDGFNAV